MRRILKGDKKHKQEELKEGIAFRYAQSQGMDYVRVGGQAVGSLPQECYDFADLILKDEDSLGVVIKVKCPHCEWSRFSDETVGMTPCYSCDSTGYIVEPLIRKDDEG